MPALDEAAEPSPLAPGAPHDGDDAMASSPGPQPFGSPAAAAAAEEAGDAATPVHPVFSFQPIAPAPGPATEDDVMGSPALPGLPAEHEFSFLTDGMGATPGMQEAEGPGTAGGIVRGPVAFFSPEQWPTPASMAATEEDLDLTHIAGMHERAGITPFAFARLAHESESEGSEDEGAAPSAGVRAPAPTPAGTAPPASDFARATGGASGAALGPAAACAEASPLGGLSVRQLKKRIKAAMEAKAAAQAAAPSPMADMASMRGTPGAENAFESEDYYDLEEAGDEGEGTPLAEGEEADLVLRLRGLPTPKGQHLRFGEDEEA